MASAVMVLQNMFSRINPTQIAAPIVIILILS
ncbi:MAG: hypothetical protein RIR18_571, partial [Pseudomonadota bacterium]